VVVVVLAVLAVVAIMYVGIIVTGNDIDSAPTLRPQAPIVHQGHRVDEDDNDGPEAQVRICISISTAH
jgi:hypothetical protein